MIVSCCKPTHGGWVDLPGELDGECIALAGSRQFDGLEATADSIDIKNRMGVPDCRSDRREFWNRLDPLRAGRQDSDFVDQNHFLIRLKCRLKRLVCFWRLRL